MDTHTITSRSFSHSPLFKMVMRNDNEFVIQSVIDEKPINFNYYPNNKKCKIYNRDGYGYETLSQFFEIEWTDLNEDCKHEFIKQFAQKWEAHDSTTKYCKCDTCNACNNEHDEYYTIWNDLHRIY